MPSLSRPVSPSPSPRSGSLPDTTAFGGRLSSRSPDPDASVPLLRGASDRPAPSSSRSLPPPAQRPGTPSSDGESGAGGAGAGDGDSSGRVGGALSRQVILFAVGIGATQLGTSLAAAAGNGYKHASELEATGASRVQI